MVRKLKERHKPPRTGYPSFTLKPTATCKPPVMAAVSTEVEHDSFSRANLQFEAGTIVAAKKPTENLEQEGNLRAQECSALVLLVETKWRRSRSLMRPRRYGTVANSRLFGGTRRQTELLSRRRGDGTRMGDEELGHHDSGRERFPAASRPQHQRLRGFRESAASDRCRSLPEGWTVVRLRKMALRRLQPQNQWSGAGESTPRSAGAWKHSGSFERLPLVDRQPFDQKCGTTRKENLYNRIPLEKGGQPHAS